MGKRCFIVGAGEGYPIRLHVNNEDMVIAVDGGFRYIKTQKIEPHILIGDFDSLGYDPQEKEKFSSDTKILKYPSEKDDTDMELAIAEGLRAGYEQFYLLGGQGGRVDHTFANIQSMRRLAQSGKKVVLYGMDFHMTVIANDTFKLQKNLFEEQSEAPLVSVFALSDQAEHVTIKGAKYEVEDVTLSADTPLGVSNCYCDEEIQITVGKGTLLILWQGHLPQDLK